MSTAAVPAGCVGQAGRRKCKFSFCKDNSGTNADFIKMQNYFRALCLAQSPEVIYAQRWSSEGCARLPGIASSSWLCSWCEGFLTLEGRSGKPQSHCLFLLKNSSCPRSSCVQLLWMEASTHRLIKCSLIKCAGLLSRDVPSLPALLLLPRTS